MDEDVDTSDLFKATQKSRAAESRWQQQLQKLSIGLLGPSNILCTSFCCLLRLAWGTKLLLPVSLSSGGKKNVESFSLFQNPWVRPRITRRKKTKESVEQWKMNENKECRLIIPLSNGTWLQRAVISWYNMRSLPRVLKALNGSFYAWPEIFLFCSNDCLNCVINELIKSQYY